MRIACILLLSLGPALNAFGSEGPLGDAAPQEQGTPKVGDTLAQVLAALGRPTGEMNGSTSRLLFYPSMRIKLTGDVVVEITHVTRVIPQMGPTPAVAQAGGQGKMVMTRDSVEVEIQQFQRDAASLFAQERFSELEDLATRLNAEKATFGDGSWKIFRLVRALYLGNHQPEGEWVAQEARIDRWEKAFPDSVTARTVHVAFLCSYAWLARGTGYASEVKPEAWDVFTNRLAQAYIVYQSAAKLPKKTPMLWYEAATIALGQAWPLEEVMAHFEEARKAEPHFWYYDATVAKFLLPRWFGKAGDWERFAEDVSRRPDGLGAEEYSLTAWELINYFQKNIFSETQLKWPRIKEGFIELMKEHPASKRLLNEYAYMAVQAADQETARGAFEAMNGEADADLWDESTLASYQKWAFAGP